MTESTDLTSGTDQNSEQNQGTGLSGLKLAQLQALAAQLGISINTVKKHLARSYAKRGLRQRRQLLV